MGAPRPSSASPVRGSPLGAAPFWPGRRSRSAPRPPRPGRHPDAVASLCRLALIEGAVPAHVQPLTADAPAERTEVVLVTVARAQGPGRAPAFIRVLCPSLVPEFFCRLRRSSRGQGRTHESRFMNHLADPDESKGPRSHQGQRAGRRRARRRRVADPALPNKWRRQCHRRKCHRRKCHRRRPARPRRLEHRRRSTGRAARVMHEIESRSRCDRVSPGYARLWPSDRPSFRDRKVDDGAPPTEAVRPATHD